MKRFKFLLRAVPAIAAALSLLIAGLWAWLLPVPQSPPLVDRQGIVLDEAAQASLVDVVFQAARDNDLLTIDEYLKSGFSPNVRNPRGDTLLIVAAYYDSVDVIRRLLQHSGTEIESRNRMGLTAVSAAAFKGHNQTLSELIQRKANVNAANGSRQTAIMFAALSGRTETVRLLRAAGANPQAADAMGNTPLSLATSQGATEVVETLKSF